MSAGVGGWGLGGVCLTAGISMVICVRGGRVATGSGVCD